MATAAAPPPLSSAANDFGRTMHEGRRRAGELGLDVGGATEDRLGDDERVAVGLELDVVGDDGAVELGRQAADDVAAVVAGGEEDGVGAVAGRDRRGDGRGDRHAGERAAEVAGGVDRGGAVGAELAGDGVGVAAAVDGLDGVAELRALVRISRVVGVTLPSTASASTQILESPIVQSPRWVAVR